MSDCIFCKIAAGEIPSTRIYEDEKLIAFMDINPIARGHCLIIPRDHHATLYDMPDDLLGDLSVLAKKIGSALVKSLEADGLNLIQSNGRAASQIIDHFHMHLIPRIVGDELNVANWQMIPAAPEELIKTADIIKSTL